ncbi:MAG: hypothetical protein Kow0099_08290 [Candidatus Abyssubacteria bacterium]
MSESSSPGIHLAFRFHVNFYHSYRGDTPDELGFGKDIRIIRNTIEVLDEYNASGVDVRGTWDIENYFSLEKIMPEHCPDIIEAWKRRVAERKDAVEVMSYNNGLISAHTPWEFAEAVGRAVSNESGSGLRELFGRFAPIVRPQEMMYTPIHLKMYPAHGIDCISLYYSAVPFNAFSNFIRPLAFEHRYNPLMLIFPDIEETMMLLPAYNLGDIADNISLRQWVKRIRRKQLRMPEPKNLLLLIDSDADDDFWYGYDWPVVPSIFSAARGLRGLVDSLRDLPYVSFTTPGEYIRSFPPTGTVTIRQDTADGSFDGLSSWAEKWSNHRLWTGIERSRILELQTRRLMELAHTDTDRSQIEQLLADSREDRLKSLSTTHFGLASPVMNLTRLRAGANLVKNSVEQAARAFGLARHMLAGPDTVSKTESFTLLDYIRGISTDIIEFEPKPSRALVRIALSRAGTETANARLLDAAGNPLPCAIRHATGDSGLPELLFVEHMPAAGRKDYRIDFPGTPPENPYIARPASAGVGVLQNEFISLRLDGLMQPVGFACSGIEYADTAFFRSAVNYDGQVREPARWNILESAMLADGLIAFTRLSAQIPLDANGEKLVTLEREFLLASGLPYLYVTTRVIYPETRSRNFNKNKARRLGREYDNNWREVMPCEIRPALFCTRSNPLRVWKHNYCGHVSYYDLDYAEFSKNREIDSLNNHITHAWVALTNGQKGLLVAQTADVNASFAFCPIRIRATPEGERVFLNPFGSYHGRQLKYVTAYTGLGRQLALRMADQLDPYAPSYNGRTETISLLVAPYSGDEPPVELRQDAEAFAYPYAVISDSDLLAQPPHRHWSFEDIKK